MAGRWLNESVVVIAYLFLSGLASMVLNALPDLLFLLGTIAIIPLSFGYIRHVMLLMRGDKTDGVLDIFFYYSNLEEAKGIILVSLLTGLLIFLQTLLLVIPGIIAAYRYTLYQQIRIDSPELTANEVKKKSSLMMRGHKFDMFVLNFSFIGWAILATITLVGWAPLLAYMTLVVSLFYEQRLEAFND